MTSIYNNISASPFDFVPSTPPVSISPSDFVTWLKGFRDISFGETSLTSHQVKIIWDKLSICDIRPDHWNYSYPKEIGYQKLFTGHSGITAQGLC